MTAEFICTGCNLAHPRTQLASTTGNVTICWDCAAGTDPLAQESRPGGHSRALASFVPLSIAQMAAWLAAHASTVMLSEFAVECLDEIRDAIANATRSIDRPPSRLLLGICGSKTDSGECRDYVYGVEGHKLARCRFCGAIHSIIDRQDWLLNAMRAQRGTAAQISEQLRALAGIEVKANTIRQWHRRDKLARDADETYLVGDVVALFKAANEA